MARKRKTKRKRKNRNTFGSIYLRKGVFYIRLRYSDAGGRRRDYRRAVSTEHDLPDDLGRTPRDLAEAELAKIRFRLETEKVLEKKEVGRITMAAFWPTLEPLLRSRLTAYGVRVNAGSYRIAAEWFGDRAIADIKAVDINDFVAHLRNSRKVTPATGNRYVALLSTMFQAAAEHGYAEGNPTTGIRRGTEQSRPVPYLSAEEIHRVVNACPAPYRDAVAVLFDTGLRRGELVALRWADVDLGRGVLTVRVSKSGRDRMVPLTPRVSGILARLPHTAKTVFPEVSPDVLSHRFPDWALRAGIASPMRLHDCRHVFASGLARAGVPIPAIAALTGHATMQMVLRYARHAPEGAGQEAVAMLARARGQVTEPPAKGPKRGARARDRAHVRAQIRAQGTGTDGGVYRVVAVPLAATPCGAAGSERGAVVGSGGFEPPEALANRFTVCPVWPLR